MIYPWQQAVWQQLLLARQQGHLPHALLLTGDSGCGHEDFVDTLARSLLCLQPDHHGVACGHCRSCAVYASGAHPDYKLTATLEDKEIISVDQIRQLNHFLGLSRSYSPVKVVVLRMAERMNVNAANSLLKSLEEPADNTHLLLTSEKPQQLLVTVRSRCQQIKLPLPTQQQGLSWLKAQAVTQPAEHLLTVAGGRPLAALALDDGVLLNLQRQWLQQLMTVLERRSSISQIATDWGKCNRADLLDWQLGLLQQFLRWQVLPNSVAKGSTTAGTIETALYPLYALIQDKPLWPLYDELLLLKALVAHPLNNTVFSENMLALWLK